MLNMTDYIEFDTISDLFAELYVMRNTSKVGHTVTLFFKDNEEDIISTDTICEKGLGSLYDFLDDLVCDELSNTIWVDDDEYFVYCPEQVVSSEEVEDDYHDYDSGEYKAKYDTYKRICNQYAVRVW